MCLLCIYIRIGHLHIYVTPYTIAYCWRQSFNLYSDLVLFCDSSGKKVQIFVVYIYIYLFTREHLDIKFYQKKFLPNFENFWWCKVVSLLMNTKIRVQVTFLVQMTVVCIKTAMLLMKMETIQGTTPLRGRYYYIYEDMHYILIHSLYICLLGLEFGEIQMCIQFFLRYNRVILQQIVSGFQLSEYE